MDVIDRLIAYYKSIGWWTARFNYPELPDMIAAYKGKCVFISTVISDREIPIIQSIGVAQAEKLSNEKALNIHFACPDGYGIRVFPLTWDEQQRLADGLRLRDLASVGILVDAGS